MLDFNDKARPPPLVNHQKELVKRFNRLTSRRSHWQVFADFCEMAAITFSNAVDKIQYEKREARYMEIVKGYDHEEAISLSQGLGEVILSLEQGFGDVLGRTFHDLELHNKWAGQFFTPYEVCRMMANMTIGDSDDLRDRIAVRGFVTAQEPAVGSGAMVIALAQAMRDAGINYQEHLHVTAIDVDPKCAHMAYIQFTLLHIPAVVIHGNTLALQEYEHWYTPAHIMGGWQWKLRRQEGIEKAHELIAMSSPEVSISAIVEADPEPAKPPGSITQLTLF